jgi:hypothetical protein
MANRRRLATGATAGADDVGAADGRASAGTNGGLEKKQKSSKSSKSRKGKSLKKSDKTSKSSKSGKGGKDSKSSYYSENLPTPAPTCLECDDIEAYQTSSSFILYDHDKPSESMTKGSPTKAFLAIGSILLVLAFVRLSLAVVTFLARRRKDSFMESVYHEGQAHDLKFSENEVTCDDDEEDGQDLVDSDSGAP